MMATAALETLKLPFSFTIRQKTIILRECPPNRYDEVIKVFVESASTSDGVGLDEFPTRDSLLQRIKSSNMVLLAEEKETNELATVCLLYQSPLCRSEKPKYHAGYQIITKNFRKIGLGTKLYVLLGYFAAINFGYKGILGRTSATSKGVIGVMQGPAIFTAVIPRSILMAKNGMTDDLVIFTNFGIDDEEMLEVPSLPILEVSDLKPFDYITFPPVPMKLKAGTFTLRPSVFNDVESVEHLIREAAESGQGFAIDEFKQNGQFNRFFFQKCHLAVLCDSNGSIVGAALFGLSSLVRTATLETSHLYIVIDKEYRNLGIGQKLLEEILTLIWSVGYKRILTDVYCYNNSAAHICHKLKFLLTGSIPGCGFVINHGHCASYIFAHQSNFSLLKDAQYLANL